MNALIFLTAALAVAQTIPVNDLKDQQWERFMNVHSKSYQNEDEEITRKTIFVENLRNFDEHNKKYEEGLVSYTIGVNEFADMTPEEFKQIMLSKVNASTMPQGLPFVPLADAKVPNKIDWRQKGAVARVKHQGRCGSCYTFSATGALEAHLFRKTGKLVELSEQNLLDCTNGGGGNFGCHGGWPSHCYKYIQSNGGINTEKSYPYEGGEGHCRYNAQNSGGQDNGFVQLPPDDEKALINAVGTVGPVTIILDGESIQFYKGGVFNGHCDPEAQNHAVVVVGYTEKFWIVRNSWGQDWGEAGYFRLPRNHNICGLARLPVYPVV